jgi:hypothetical protein
MVLWMPAMITCRSTTAFEYERIWKYSYNKRNEGEMVGFDEHFAPTCLREHSYRYESFDEKYPLLEVIYP